MLTYIYQSGMGRWTKLEGNICCFWQIVYLFTSHEELRGSLLKGLSMDSAVGTKNDTKVKEGNHDCDSVESDLGINFMISFLHFLPTFIFKWEGVSNTRDSVWLSFQTHRSSSKILHYGSYFQLPSSCLEMWLNTVFCVWYITCRSV